MKTKDRTVVIALLSILAIVILYLFWGPLFPWNPLKIGYQRIPADKAMLYIRDFTERDSAVYRIDEIIREEEAFHDLEYSKPFKIVVLGKDANMKRYLPWLKGTGYSVSLSYLNLVYIGRTARRSQQGIEAYLRHELSHLLLGQNTSPEKALMIHRQGWFTEGIAEYFSGHTFYSKAEFAELCRKNDIRFSGLLETNPHKMSITELKFKYSFYKYFIDYLVANYGLDSLQAYLKLYIQNPQQYRGFFVPIYECDLDTLLDEFNRNLQPC